MSRGIQVKLNVRFEIQEVWTMLLELSKNSVSEILDPESIVIQFKSEANMNNLFFDEEVYNIEFDFGIYIHDKDVKFY